MLWLDCGLGRHSPSRVGGGGEEEEEDGDGANCSIVLALVLPTIRRCKETSTVIGIRSIASAGRHVRLPVRVVRAAYSSGDAIGSSLSVVVLVVSRPCYGCLVLVLLPIFEKRVIPERDHSTSNEPFGSSFTLTFSSAAKLQSTQFVVLPAVGLR